LVLKFEPMLGWERWMRWPDFSDLWVPTSPNVNSFEAALLYPGIGLFGAVSSVNEGPGTPYPFRFIGAEWMDQFSIVSQLNARKLSGLTFETAQMTPRAPPGGKAQSIKLAGKTLDGVRIRVLDYSAVAPLEAGITILQVVREHARLK